MLAELGSNIVEIPERIKTIPLHVVHALPVAKWIENKIGDCTMHVFLRNSGEYMLINNLKMRITELDRHTETICTVFEEDLNSQTKSPLELSSISSSADILQIADQFYLVLSRIDDDNRSSFYLALKRSVLISKSPRPVI